MSKFFGGGTLSLKYRSDLIFLHPKAATEIQDDAIFEGTVVLTLPSARKVKRLDMELIGRQNMYLMGKYEQYDTLHRKLTIDIFEKYGELSAGKHEFAWSFVIPANTAPYERLKIARTYHKLVATAYGCGKFGSDLQLVEPDIGIVNNSNEIGQAPSGYSESTETVHSVLGPLRVSLFTRYFLISGWLRLRVRLLDVAQRVRIEGVKVVLVQNVKLKSLKEPNKGEEMTPPLNVILYDSKVDRPSITTSTSGSGTHTPTVHTPSAGPSRTNSTGPSPSSNVITSLGREGVTLPANAEFSLIKKMRVADDDMVRPSTNEHSETGIRLSHQMLVVITFTALDEHGEREGETKEMKIKWDAKLSSCDCMLENLQVPSYSHSESTSPAMSPSPSRPSSPGPDGRSKSRARSSQASHPSYSPIGVPSPHNSFSGGGGGGSARHGYILGARTGAIHKSQCLCSLGTQESLDLTYGVHMDDDELRDEDYDAEYAESEAFARLRVHEEGDGQRRARGRGRRGRWKDDEEFGRELIDDLRR